MSANHRNRSIGVRQRAAPGRGLARRADPAGAGAKPVGNRNPAGDNRQQLCPVRPHAKSCPDLSRALCVQPVRLSTGFVQGQASGARALFGLIPRFAPALL